MPSRAFSSARDLSRRAATLSALASVVTITALAGCSSTTGPGTDDIVNVPNDVATITEATEKVAPGGLILIEPGVYEEQVLVDTPDITIRGLDRNETIIDGGGTRPYGIAAIADGVSVENLTVTNTVFYGVLITGLHDEEGPDAHGVDGYDTLDPIENPPVERFAIDHVTAYNNGLYGLYAFNARHGVISNSYASGSADSGIYVGQCTECDIEVSSNVAEHNAVGFENANASDSVYVVGNRFSHNRVGATFLSNYQEAFAPQRANLVVGNLFASNTSDDSPSQADGGFGIGVGIAGGTDNRFERNRIEDNPRAGVMLSSTEDLAALGNSFSDDVFAHNGVDVANVSTDRAPAQGNCFTADKLVTAPSNLLEGCGLGSDQPSAPQADLPHVASPPGVSFLTVGPPPPQPQLVGLDAPARVLPGSVGKPPVADLPVPALDYLADRARS